MTPPKFFLRYTAVPFVALVLVGGWAFNHESGEIGARQYAALVAAYPGFSQNLKDEIDQAMHSGKLDKADYASIVRHSLEQGYVLDWPATDTDLNGERGRLLGLVKNDERAPL